MRPRALFLVVLSAPLLALATPPAFAGIGGIELPTLTWPTDDVSSSTMGCRQAPSAPCK